MDPVGLSIGIVGLAGQLAKSAADYYKIFDDMGDVGTTYDSILHKLRTGGFGSRDERKLGDLRFQMQIQNRLQQSLSMYRKLRWVVADKAKLDDLLRTLTSLNDGLFHVLPTLPGPVYQAKSQVSKLTLSFDIPFLSEIRKSSEFVGKFVGREYLIESLKQNIEEGKHTQNTIVLYGTGGMH
ncbi:hypothetical protein BGX38DRAFT_1330622 [Terfezia claveryi]|nr:hypothetical protein BGX38DRAFT_1330622 [Terfezia claveryi]